MAFYSSKIRQTTLFSVSDYLKQWAISRENAQGGNDAATNTWQAHHLRYYLSALISERLFPRLSHLHTHLYGSPSPM